jgi:hypothetical protein
MTREIEPVAVHQYEAGELSSALEFLKRTRSELRQLRFVRVWTDRFAIYDVNQDRFEILSLGYEHQDIVPVLDAVNTAFKRETIHEPTSSEYKQFKTGRRYPWAYDRVM